MAGSGALGPGGGAGAAAVACKTISTPGGPCNFQAQQGQLTLQVISLVGAVGIASAAYKGNPIAGTPSQSITFQITAGAGNLDVVYVFSDTAAGSGELHEACSGNTLLDPGVSATAPAKTYTICS